MRVLFVCTGNICRSPTAHGVLRDLSRSRGLSDRIEVDSAGTHSFHVGEPPDRRAQAHARRRGYDLGALRARSVVADDFEHFDLVLAMDRGHLQALRRMALATHHYKLHLTMHFSQERPEREVSDPYYGGEAGFEQVLDMVEAAAAGILAAATGAQR